MLKKLDVCRSGFYDYLKRVPSKTKLRKERITKPSRWKKKSVGECTVYDEPDPKPKWISECT